MYIIFLHVLLIEFKAITLLRIFTLMFSGLSSDELDGTSQNQIVEEAESPVGVGPLPLEPVSMPPVLSSSSTGGFSYRNPAYRSANPSTTKSKGSMCEV